MFFYSSIRMNFAKDHLCSHIGELHMNKDATGDFSFSCQGKVIKAHSWILSSGYVTL